MMSQHRGNSNCHITTCSGRYRQTVAIKLQMESAQCVVSRSHQWANVDLYCVTIENFLCTLKLNLLYRYIFIFTLIFDRIFVNVVELSGGFMRDGLASFSVQLVVACLKSILYFTIDINLSRNKFILYLSRRYWHVPFLSICISQLLICSSSQVQIKHICTDSTYTLGHRPTLYYIASRSIFLYFQII